ncbi:MAG: glycosyltransferase family 9 protein [Chloroflexi bacterium]|nr:glycosyltransferase family 9 protein [Chloroflexota bacterium]MCC6894406.1 glycosyltransferase family 9 protein [Anaerolineae bacterium]
MNPKRIVLILPCCIGDVVLATATLMALRRAYPQAHITWAVGSWSKGVIEHHPMLDAVLDTGKEALPVKSVSGFIGFVRQLRAGHFDLAVSLVRSPLMSAALLLSGIPQRAGLNSAGRGFGYTVKASVDPNHPRHEAEIYLDVPRALGLDVAGCIANVPVDAESLKRVQAKLAQANVTSPYLVINPTGGRNPGMTMDSKRWPPESFAALADKLAPQLNTQVVLIGGPNDGDIVSAVASRLHVPYTRLDGQFSFGETAALASQSLLYVGNDTGVTHLAAAAGAKTVMILGPSDPQRYAPFTPDSLALWKSAAVDRRGVAGGQAAEWDWARDGVSVDEVLQKIIAFVLGTQFS